MTLRRTIAAALAALACAALIDPFYAATAPDLTVAAYFASQGSAS